MSAKPGAGRAEDMPEAPRVSDDLAPGPRLCLAFLGDSRSIHTRRWTAFFVDRGHEVHLLVPHKDTVSADLDPRIKVRRFRAWPRLPGRGLGTIVTALALRRALRAIHPDVLHAHYLTRYGLAARLSGFRPYVVTVWGSDVFVTPRGSERSRIWAKRVLSNAALVTAVSLDLAKGAIELGARPDRVKIVQFGVDPNLFAPAPAPASLRTALGLDGQRVVFSPRGLKPIYRHEVAIEALALLPADVTLLLVRWEPDEEYRDRLERLIRERGLAGRVRFLEPIAHSAIADHYRLADVVVSLPSSDAFPVTALEAMACGVPIVMGDVPSAHEGLDVADPTAIVRGDDPSAVAAAVLARLELAAPARAELGARLRRAAIERGDVRRSLLEMEALYRDLASRRKRNRRAS